MPVIFALRNALFLEPPSQSQQQFARSAEEQRSHMNQLEFKMLLNKKRTSSATKESGDSSDADEVLPHKIIQDLKRNAAKRKTDKVQFKRKRAKGPNPLSCKKKKTENQNHVAKKVSCAIISHKQTPPPKEHMMKDGWTNNPLDVCLYIITGEDV